MRISDWSSDVCSSDLRVEGDETCEIAGVGPVSVSAVRRLLSDAFLTLVLRKGSDIRNVTHLGRQVTAAQRTAMEARSEEHTSELQSLMRISYAVFCLKKNKKTKLTSTKDLQNP